MRRAATSIGAGVVLAVSATGAIALGFGGVSNSTVLGQPLSFSVPLRMATDEFVAVECISAEVHAGENRIPPPQVRVALDRGRDSADRILRVTTSALIDEPVVTVDLHVGCPPILSRKFVAFVDPPVVNLAQAAAPAPMPAVPAAGPAAAENPNAVAAAPAPQARTARIERSTAASTPLPARRTPRPVARPSTAAPNAVATPRPRPSSEPAARVAPPAVAASGGARLQLEAADAAGRAASAPPAAASAPVVATAPTAAALAAMTASAASQPDAADQQAKERDRIRLLEESLARIRSDADANRSSINALQARLRQEEARRYNNPLVYGLLAVIAALVLAIGFLLWWARARDRQRAQWWAAGADDAQAARASIGPPTIVPPPEVQPPDSVLPAGFGEPTKPLPGPVTWKPTLAIPELDKNEVPKRAVSAEELIDLEQQAEFFITLGQDESAIDLLVGHLNNAGGISPLPYLKLMEIHRRRGDLPAYERIREHFNQRFNAYAPPGDTTQPAPRSLEDHADVIAQLQEAWPTPPRAMGLLESLLFKSGEGDAAFDLAAYREVLFLHEVARDLYEREISPIAVDVLLPLDDEVSVIRPNPMTNTMAVQPHAEVERPIALDLDLGQPRDEEAEQAAVRAERRKERYGDDDFLFGSGTGSGFGTDNLGKPPHGRKGPQ
jgi:pilus assembly protein FimV